MRIALVILPATLAIGIAGCGAGYSAGTPASAPAAAAAKHAAVSTRHGKLGTYLVDARGRTLYRFMKDSGPRSRCSGACAAAWPPLTTREQPEAQGGAKAKLLSTSKRGNGARQVVYNGRPLYRYEPDTAAGQTRGQGVSAFGARWYVVAASGRVITAANAPSPSSSSTPAPYGY
jgi:predicted lipoprotein with Yx(FWY)xxD motif